MAGARKRTAAADTYRQLSLSVEHFEGLRADYVEKARRQQADRNRRQRHAGGIDPQSGYMGFQGASRNAGDDLAASSGGLGIEVTMEDGLIKVVDR